MNIDEVLNYELANGTNGWSLAIEDGRAYSDREPFFEKMVVHEDGGFSYADVWKNREYPKVCVNLQTDVR